MKRVYMDNMATTELDDRVLEAMLPNLGRVVGNPSSIHHWAGSEARKAVDEAREEMAALVGASSADEIIFTSGATESCNLALGGWVRRTMQLGRKPRLIVSAIEHRAVLETAEVLAMEPGVEVRYVGCGASGVIEVGELDSMLEGEPGLVSIMAVNNETGIIQPLKELADLVASKGWIFHTDATQMAGRLPLKLSGMEVGSASFTAHKFHGPPGIGVLYANQGSRRFSFSRLMHGGAQESGLRAGTLNVPGIVGMAVALRLAVESMHDDAHRLILLSRQLLSGLMERISPVHLVGGASSRIPGVLSLMIPGVEGKTLAEMVGEELAISTGSSCSSESPEPSHVLRAMGFEWEEASSVVRISMGRFNSMLDVEHALEVLPPAVGRLREMNEWYSRPSREIPKVVFPK